MRFVSAYLMATMGGNASPTKDDVRAILGSVGADVDEGKLDLLFEQIAGKDVAELLAAGREKLAFAATCGVAVVGQVAAGGGAAVEAKGKAEDKVEEKKAVEEEDDDDVDVDLFNLFD